MIFYSSLTRGHNLPGHPENAKREEVVMEAIRSDPDLSSLLKEVEKDASLEDIKRVHCDSYVEKILALKEDLVWLDPDTYFVKGSWPAARRAAGLAIKATEYCLTTQKNSFAITRPPGHHARPSAAMGFCIFNNIAIAAAWAVETHVKKVFIVDWDLHHGNGTQEIFYHRGDVFYFSVHQFPYYPGTGLAEETGEGAGKGATLNVPLPAGCGDNEYLKVWDSLLLPTIKKFSPDLLLISAGFDPWKNDPLGGMRITERGFYHMARKLYETGIPMAAVFEGGYDLQNLGRIVTIAIRGLFGLPYPSSGQR